MAEWYFEWLPVQCSFPPCITEANDMLDPTQREATLGEVSAALSDAVPNCHVNTSSVR